MTKLLAVLRVIADTGFYVFLAAYWYLVHSLYPEYAIAGATAVYVLVWLLRSRVQLRWAPWQLMLVSALTFFLMLNPLPGLYGFTQLLWFALSALAFRLSFGQLEGVKWKSAPRDLLKYWPVRSFCSAVLKRCRFSLTKQS